MIDKTRLARIALGSVAEPGSKELFQAVQAHGPVEALDRIIRGTGSLGEGVLARLGNGDPWELAARRLEHADRTGMRIVTPEDPEWPPQLEDLKLISREGGDRIARDTFPPQCIWVRGPLTLLAAFERSVAIVGARASTPYGDHIAGDFAFTLAEQGWTVVSGGAFGIDAAAHRGALTAGGVTAAVLACGLDRAYPVAHTGLFDRIADDGLLISEWPPGSMAHKHRFLIRNRVIAALTRGTVMVEASARSGARQTLGRARLLGRRPMVVPGPVTSAMSVGCHEALRVDGFRLVASVAQVLEEVGPIGQLSIPASGPDRLHDALDDLERMLVDALPARGSATAAKLAQIAGVPLRAAAGRLPSLVTRGVLAESEEGYRLPR
ncbi:DNA processing protein [Allocatelliglobosispora scoriae]|uniref:DNA processing protein n=1 Tax=Allocatelliglobosispora scoriae TaxID=643052 RepID=A0A841BZA1_9ACTN|nr:DNA-processing protein DprA [Allocatelliglobosispora scoriae]MBB5872233.1 DNA processing protein [Allocatelliglobosispora scoriae]